MKSVLTDVPTSRKFFAGYTNEERQKTPLTSPYLAPSGVILDAELTLATPERLWSVTLAPGMSEVLCPQCTVHRLSTGMRAVDHAVENLYGPSVIPPMKHLGYGAIVDLFEYLPQSKADPNDVHARQKLQVAAWMSLWPVRYENR